MQSVKIINDHTIQRQSYIWFFTSYWVSFEDFNKNKSLIGRIKELDNKYKIRERMHLFDSILLAYWIEPKWFPSTQCGSSFGYFFEDFIDKEITEIINSHKINFELDSDELNKNYENHLTNNNTKEMFNIFNNENWYLNKSEKILNNYVSKILFFKNKNKLFWDCFNYTNAIFRNSNKKIECYSETRAKQIKLSNNSTTIKKFNNSTYSVNIKLNHWFLYLLFLTFCHNQNLYLIINNASKDINIVDYNNIALFLNWDTTIIPLFMKWYLTWWKEKNIKFIDEWLISIKDLNSQNSESHEIINDEIFLWITKTYKVTKDDEIIDTVCNCIENPQIKKIEIEKHSSYLILRPTFVKYDSFWVPDNIILDAKNYGSTDKTIHISKNWGIKKTIYYTPTYKLSKVAKTEWKNIDSN